MHQHLRVNHEATAQLLSGHPASHYSWSLSGEHSIPFSPILSPDPRVHPSRYVLASWMIYRLDWDTRGRLALPDGRVAWR